MAVPTLDGRWSSGIHQGLPDVIPVNGAHPSGDEGDIFFSGLFEALIHQARRVDPG